MRNDFRVRQSEKGHPRHMSNLQAIELLELYGIDQVGHGAICPGLIAQPEAAHVNRACQVEECPPRAFEISAQLRGGGVDNK